MNQIPPAEYELLLDCIRELHSVRDLSALRSWLLDTALPILASERHRAVLEMLRPHLVAAFNQLALASETRMAYTCAKKQGAPALELTPREAEVCHWICEGKANAEIAVILGASPRTVHKHVEHIFAKTGVASRVALAALLNGEG